MKILIVSNLYPPCVIGGYEIACADIAGQLSVLGHEVEVLTSDYRADESAADEPGVSRVLKFVPFGKRPSAPLEILALNRGEKAKLARAAARFRPDVIYFWNAQQIAGILPFAALETGVPVVFYFSGYWWLEGNEWDSWIRFWEKKSKGRIRHAYPALKPFINRLLPLKKEKEKIAFAHFSGRDGMRAFQEAGIEIEDSEVIPHGVDTSVFSPGPGPAQKPFRIIYSGQIVEHKGVHTVIEALSILFKKGKRDFQLTLLGPEVIPDYACFLKEKIRQEGLEEVALFAGAAERSQLPGLYRQHHVLVFPSIYREPFGISPLEAMACGLCVIGTGAGGSAEFLKNNVTALTFPAGDAAALAACLERAEADPALRRSLGEAARAEVCRNYELKNVALKIEAALTRVAAGRGASAGRVQKAVA